MHKRGGVHELERLGEVEHDLVIVAGPEARGEEHERRPQELARRAEEMLDRRRERRMPAAPDLEQPSLELAQLRVDGRIEGALRPPRDHATSLGSD